MSKFVITGTLVNGRRFKPIHTDTPWHYNIWMGTLWKLEDGKRKKVADLIEGGVINVRAEYLR